MAEPRTSEAMVALFEATLPQLQALAETVAPQARRHAHAAVPALLLADARTILGAAQRVLAREAGLPGPLHLGPAIGWAELDAKLALALAGFRAFKTRYYGFDARHEACLWCTNAPRTRRLRTPPNQLARRALAQTERQLERLEKEL